MTLRTPDFIVIGAMKAGTTSLYRWLEAQPEVMLPSIKEPNFFSRDDAFAKGPSWYSDLFQGIPADMLTGEASTSYTDPVLSAVVADRMSECLSATKLIFVTRDRVDRMRSHHAHEARRGRERRSLAEVLTKPDNPYVQRSCYALSLSPFLDRFSPEQLLVTSFERVVGAGQPGWCDILDHLGLPARPAPGTNVNASNTRVAFNPAAKWLWEHGLLLRLKSRAPAFVRRIGRRSLEAPTRRYLRSYEEAATALIPPAVHDVFTRDAAQLEARMRTWRGTELKSTRTVEGSPGDGAATPAERPEPVDGLARPMQDVDGLDVERDRP